MRKLSLFLFALLLPITANAVTCTGATYLYSSNVPAGYTELEYIESTGTQYIDTGWQETQTTAIDAKFYIIDFLTNYLYGSSKFPNGNNDVFNGLYGSWGGSIILEYGGAVAYYLDRVNMVTMSQSINNSDLLVTINNDQFSTPLHSGTPTQSVLIGAIHENGIRYYDGRYRLYYFIIKDNSDVVRNFIPARRNSDGEVGMYDTVTDTFFTNSGTGAFVAGADVGTCLACPNGYDFNTVNGKISPSQCQINCNAGTYVSAPLPTGYTKLEYIESTGTQYIDTRYIVDYETFKIESKAIKDTSYSLFGADPLSFTGAGGYIYYYYGSGTQYGKHVPTNPYSPHVFVLDTGKLYIDGELKSPSASGVTGKTPGALYLFARNVGGRINDAGSHRVYYFKIWDGNTLVFDLIPARRNSDNAVGMYDTVTDTFFTNSGTGTFVAGADAGGCVDVGVGYWAAASTVNFGTAGTRTACTNKPANSSYSASGTSSSCPWTCDTNYWEYSNACHARCPYGDGELHVGQYTHPLWADITNVPSPSVYIGELGPNHDGLCYAYLEPDDTPVDNHHGFHTVHNGVPYHAINLGLYGLE